MKALSVFLVLAVASASVNAQPSPPPPGTPRTLQAESGRFVLGQISSARADQYMLDTKTGRLWQLVSRKVTNDEGKVIGEVMILQPVSIVDPNTGKETVTPPQ